jgi:hypothetical protein
MAFIVLPSVTAGCGPEQAAFTPAWHLLEALLSSLEPQDHLTKQKAVFCADRSDGPDSPPTAVA